MRFEAHLLLNEEDLIFYCVWSNPPTAVMKLWAGLNTKTLSEFD